MVGISLLKNTDGAIAARDINALARTVIKNVVGIIGTREFGHYLPRLCVENNKFCRFSKPDKQPVMRLVERHWKISGSPSSGPCCNRHRFLTVHDHYVLGCRNIYEDTWPGPL